MTCQLGMCGVLRLGKAYWSNDNNSCIKIDLAYTEKLYASVTAERDLLCVWAAELEFAKACSCLAEMKGKKGNLHLLALIIATFFANFIINLIENSHTQNEQIIHTQTAYCFTGLLDQVLESRKAPAVFMGFV